MVRRSHADRLVVVQHEAAKHPFLEILPGVVHLLGGQLVLLVGFVLHEDEVVLLLVEELGLDFVDLGGVEGVAAFVGAVQHGAAEQVPQLAFVERLALAGLDEVALDHDVRIAVQLDLQALAKLAGVVASHDCCSRFDYRLGVGGDKIGRNDHL